MNLQELTESRVKLVTDARGLLEKSKTEKREMTDEESRSYDKMLDDAEAIDKTIAAEKTSREREARLANMTVAEGKTAPAAAPAPAETRDDPTARQAREFRGWLHSSLNLMDRLTPDERRDLSMGTNILGGNIIPPEQFVADIIKQVDDLVFIRPLAYKVMVTGAHDLGIPTLDANPADADWTSELATGSADTTTAFGKRTWKPNPIAKRVLISNKLLRTSPIDVEAYMRDRLAYKFGITQEKAFLTGDGVAKPLGVFTASADGISTARDVSTGNSTTAIGADGLIEAKYKIKGAYWPKLNWVFHRDALKQISKLKDGEGTYIWRLALTASEPDTLLGSPVRMSEYAPNTFTTGLYVGIVGDFSKYYIADALDMQLQRLTELYAESNKIGLIGRMETDGMPVLEEAFARVTLA